jgi:acyl-CoA synthetase (AMP-forming)/AMP-acid ligase II
MNMDAEAPIALSFAQQRMWLLDRMFPGEAAYNQSHAVRLPGDLGMPMHCAGRSTRWCAGTRCCARTSRWRMGSRWRSSRRPELTARSFAKDPFDADPRARMYRTGDFARCRPDGNLEFLERRDQQVKIRGIRVELGEIEATAGQHPQVRLCVVNPWKDATGEERLVAYLVARARPELASGGAAIPCPVACADGASAP